MWRKSKHNKCDLYLEFLRDAAKYVRTLLIVCYLVTFNNSLLMTECVFTDLLMNEDEHGTWFHGLT